MFISETKTTVCHSMTILNGLHSNFVCWVDVVGCRVGLLVLGWTNFQANVIVQSSNYITCNILELNGNIYGVCVFCMVIL